MKGLRKHGRLIALHGIALTITIYTLTQGTVNVFYTSGFDPGLEMGKWAIRFLLLCLAVTPANTYLHWRWAIPLRKWLGLWAFAFALIHLGVYLYAGVLNHRTWADTLRMITTQSYIVLGLVGLLILLALALTSHRLAMRLLKKNWKRLHRLVYGAGGLIAVHALMATTRSKLVLVRDPDAVIELWAYAIILALLLVIRLPPVKRLLRDRAMGMTGRVTQSNGKGVRDLAR